MYLVFIGLGVFQCLHAMSRDDLVSWMVGAVLLTYGFFHEG